MKRAVASHSVAAILGAALAVWSMGDFSRQQAASPVVAPKVAEPTKTDATAKRVEHDCGPVKVVTLEPDRKGLERLAAKWGLRVVSAPSGDADAGGRALVPSLNLAALGASSELPEVILAEVVDERAAPDGVEVLSTLDPEGNNVLRVKPRKPKFAAFVNGFEFFVEKSILASEGRTALGVVYDFGRVRRIHLKASGMAEEFDVLGGVYSTNLRISWQ